ncbi:MAG TPA: thioesterase family protein, partial [Thermoanaerobaculia bacterium]|nr:thioesterase family protein [Thermoanaerobaculia bacterium]
KYRRPFLYDDEVVIRTFVEFAGNRSIRFRYALYDETCSTLRADGTTSHFWLDRTTRKPVTANPEIVGLFTPFVG